MVREGRWPAARAGRLGRVLRGRLASPAGRLARRGLLRAYQQAGLPLAAPLVDHGKHSGNGIRLLGRPGEQLVSSIRSLTGPRSARARGEQTR